MVANEPIVNSNVKYADSVEAIVSIKCPCCHRELHLREIREGKFSPQCPKCGEVFVMRLQVMTNRAYRKYRDQRRAGIDAIKMLERVNGNGHGRHASASQSHNGQSHNGQSNIQTPAVLSQNVSEASLSAIVDSVEPMSHAGGVAAGFPEVLAGYKIVKPLGHGGMGDVFLATQLSLNRAVAIKTIRSQYANNPVMLSRFTREAYAAAQLTHHNIVQVYDMSEDRGIHFFSMEFVEGCPLDQLIKRNKLDHRTAIGYTLQAARGLLFAHEHGMVHRDVKPANLLLSQHGLVKVADLGLVKTRDSADIAQSAESPSIKSAFDSQATLAGESMGSPAFMAPEQCDDAATVDHRADIYSLGCTLYMLLTGRPPFQGATAEEVMRKHRSAEVEPPNQLDASIPPAIAALTVKMLAKQREERPSGLPEVISQLEQQLEQGGSPRARFADAMQNWALQFRSPRLAAYRPKIVWALYGACGVMALLLLVQFQFTLAFSAISVPIVATIAYGLASGLTEQDFLTQQLRELVFASRWTDYGIWLLTALALVGFIYITQLYVLAIVVATLGVGAAVAFVYGIDRPLVQQRAAALAGAKAIVRQMRLEGMDEQDLQRLTAESCGEWWEELFERLFSYKAKMDTRSWMLEHRDGFRFHKHAVWRDKLVALIRARLDELDQARQRARVRKLELARLTAEGHTSAQARKLADEEAQRMTEQIVALRTSAREFANADAQRRRDLKQMVTLSRSSKRARVSGVREWLSWLQRIALGGRTRFALGACLLTLGMLWLNHNHVFDTLQQTVSNESVTDLSVADLNSLGSQLSSGLSSRASYEPLPYLPGFLGGLLGCLGTSVAGLLLLVTAPCRGLTGIALALFSALTAILGPAMIASYLPEIPFPIPILQPDELVAFLLAIVSAGLAWWVGE